MKKRLNILIVLVSVISATIWAQAPTITSITPASGPAGSLVTITGTGFLIGENNTIRFQSAADPQYESVIQAGSPGGITLAVAVPTVTEGVYLVSITTGAGTSNSVQFTVTPAPTPTPLIPNCPKNLLGDVNQDFSVDIVDALLVAQIYVGLLAMPTPPCADVNGSGSIDIVDALMIAQYYVGLITEFPQAGATPVPETPAPSPTSTCLPCSSSLRVYVYDSVTGAPIQGACISSNCTDANGYVFLQGHAICEAGFTATLKVTATGYVTQTQSGTYYCNQTVKFYLDPA
jgi:hypothetical protein